MSLAVLGPLRGESTAAFGRRDRAVLTALALRVGQTVSADQLADAVWGDDPPPTFHKSIQGCVVRLRKALGADAIDTSPQGYRLTLPVEDVDSVRFERLVGRGRELLALCEPERAAYLLTQALDLWRGRPFEEIEGWDPAVVEASRLEELRLEAEELRVEASLRSGRHREVLAAAEGMVQAAPLRERRWNLLALAQYQSGAQSEALRTIERVKTMLTSQLGVDPGPELVSLELAILRQDDSLRPKDSVSTSLSCPYMGLTPYDVDDSESFFGRDDDVQVCLGLLNTRAALFVVGPSGSGKSSLVRAGVAARLRRDGRSVVVVTPGEHPMQSIGPMPDARSRPVLLVDQCEEAFSLCKDEAEREEFFAELVRRSERGTLVLAMRADRLSDVSAYPGFARVLERGLHLLGAMSEQGLRDAVEAPARQAGLLVEPGLVDLLVAEVGGTPGALPLLSHALQETWKRREGATLTVAGYTVTGGIKGAVAQSAEKVYASVDPDRRQLLRDLMLRLVTAGSEGEPVRGRVPKRRLAASPDQEHLIELLVASRLVTSDDGVVEIAHEALARAWPRLRSWLDDDMEGQRMLHHLTGAADAWDGLGRPDSELYRGVRLTQALQWKERQQVTLTDTEVDFLLAAERNEQSEQRAAEERARTQTRLIHRLRGVLVGAAILLVVALAAGGVAVQQQGEAEDNANAALSAEAAAEARRAGARALVTEDIDESMLLAVAGVRLDDSPETRSSLLAALGRRPELIASTQMAGPGVLFFDVSPDGSTVATYDFTHHVRLYNIDTGELMAESQAGPRKRLEWISEKVRFSPDGRTLAVTIAAPTRNPVELLDAQTLEPLPQQPRGVERWRWQLNGLTFSDDGSHIAAILVRVQGGRDTAEATSRWAFVWDLSAPARPSARVSLGGWGPGVALSPDGDTLYTAQPLMRHDLSSGRSVQLPEPWPRGDSAETVEMSPTGRVLAASGPGGVAMLNPATGELRRQMKSERDDATFYVSFSADGSRVAGVGYPEGEGLVWEVRTGELLARIPLDGAGEATDFGADGSTLYTTSEGSSLRHWDIEGDRRFISQVAFAPPDIGDLSFVRPSPGGDFISFPMHDQIAFFDVRSNTLGAPVERGDGYRSRTASGSWHPDGVHFALATEGEIRIWDARTSKVQTKGKPSGPHVTSVDHSTDGSRLVIGELSGRVAMLDATTLAPVGRPVQLDESVVTVAAGPDNHTAFVLMGFQTESGFFLESSPDWALVDLQSGTIVDEGTLGFAGGPVDFSPDGLHVAIAAGVDGDGEVLVLDLETREPVRKPAKVHEGVSAITYAADGSRFLTSGFEAVALWDGDTGELLARVVTPEEVTEAAFQADPSSVLIAPLFGGPIYEWDTRVDRAVGFACRLAGRDFSEAEWTQEFGDRPYEHVCAQPG